MAEQTLTRIGRFVWHDLMTTDLEKSVEFYSALLGWTTEMLSIGGESNYAMIKAGDAGIGGYVPMDPKDGLPSHWIGYVTVEDVDAAVKTAREAGGDAPVEGTDLPNVGRFAVVSHSGGSWLSPFAPVNLEETTPEAMPVPGRFCWNQLMSKDPESAGAFYGKVLGWQAKRQDVDGSPYWLFERDDAPSAGMMSTPDREKHPDFWLPYVEVDDVDACAEMTPGLGGQVMVPPSDIPGLARFSVIAEPTGAILAISRHIGRP